jgi:hypothetical protein
MKNEHHRLLTAYKAQGLAESIPEKIEEAMKARHTVTAHKKADQGILLCEQLARLAREMRAEFVEIKVEFQDRLCRSSAALKLNWKVALPYISHIAQM